MHPVFPNRCSRADPFSFFLLFFPPMIHPSMSRVVGGPTVVACSPPRRSLSMSIRSLHVRWVLGEMQKSNGPREAIVVGWSSVQRPRRTRAVFPRPRNGPWTRTGLTAGDALVSNCRNLCNPATYYLPSWPATAMRSRGSVCHFFGPPKHAHSTSGTSVALAQCTTCPTRSIGSPWTIAVKMTDEQKADG